MESRLEVICGPMFSGKTEELIRRARRAEIAKQSVIVFKPDIDTRSGDCLASHSRMEHPAIIIEASSPGNILVQVLGAEVVCIEEVQFFTPNITQVIEILLDQGKRVIVAGLDMDAWGKPFGVMPHLMAVAEKVKKLSAICTECGDEATRSQKLAGTSNATVDVGAADKYEARCRKHFTMP